MREGWTETTLGSVFQLSNRKLGKLQEEPEIFAISKYEGVVLARDYFDRRIASQSLDGYKVIGPNDWVYSTIHIDEGSIAVNHFPFAGVVSPMYTSMIWDSLQHDSRFFEYLLKSDEALIRYQENAQGTVNRRRSLSWKTFSDLIFLVPPVAEQKRIVDVVSSVDTYIDSLQQQVDAARTARNAVLHELLESLSKFPVKKLKDLTTKIGSGATPRGGESVYLTSGITLIRSQNVHNSEFLHEGLVAIDDFAAKALNGVSVEPNDVLINITGASVARTCLVDETVLPARVNQHVAIIRTKKVELLPGFLLQILLGQTMNSYLLDISGSGTTRQAITKAQLEDLEIVVPPIAEQKRIVEIVSSMDDVIQATERAVVEAKNLRSGLLSDLLSGEHEIPVSYDELLGAA